MTPDLKAIKERCAKAMQYRFGANPGLTIMICGEDLPACLQHISQLESQLAEAWAALTEAKERLEAWGPAPADALFIKDAVLPLLAKAALAGEERGK